MTGMITAGMSMKAATVMAPARLLRQQLPQQPGAGTTAGTTAAAIENRKTDNSQAWAHPSLAVILSFLRTME